MKILELDIENVRGIIKFSIKPNGENIAIHGPNGSGKSAVVDAIDFLLTGDISRLGGRGTKGISVKDHGPHIDHKPKEAAVKAKIQLEGIKDPLIIERRMSKPKDLICHQGEKASFDILQGILGKGQNVLSRDEILKYIASEAGKRAEEIQAVLNLNEIEDLRKCFVSARKEADTSMQGNKTSYETSIASIKAAIPIEPFSEKELLKKINESRQILKGEPLKALDPDKLQEGLSPVASEGIDPESLKRNLSEAHKIISEKGAGIYAKEKELRQIIETLKKDARLRKELASKKLLDLGISLIDETTTECPLCLKLWEPKKLKELIDKRLSKAKEAENIQKKIQETTSFIDAEITKLKGHQSIIIRCCKDLKEEDIGKEIEAWTQRLTDWSNNLKKAIDGYPAEEELKEDIKRFMAPSTWETHKTKLKGIASQKGKLTPEQKAWDNLTTLKPLTKRYMHDKKEYEESKQVSIRAATIEKIYTETKDKVLETLYQSVNNDFIAYYKFLHGDDEKAFISEIKPEGSALDFKVNFYGRGKHHPRALHSEGHQDSMGLCLYLALFKRISEGKIKIIILDDVVMSIDNEHRRNICKLITKFFPDLQFIITTHNKTWARQLSTDGVIKRQNLIEFKGWTVDNGPIFEEGIDVWQKINSELEKNEVSSAAHELRAHAEFFYERVCESIGGKVCYKSDGRWELGDYLAGTKEAYKNLLKDAKRSANSWGKKEDVEKYDNMETVANEVIQRSQVEQWGINANVHYSKWDDFSKEDFLPIAEAFQDLEGLFKCTSCKGIISLNFEGTAPTNVACPCGQVFWNLKIRK